MRSISLRTGLIVILYWVMAHSSHAQTFYKCMSARGQPEFSEQPCSGLPAQRVESINCQKARKDLDVAARSNSLAFKDLQTRRSAMFSACGMKPPHVTIINNPMPARAY